MHIITFLYSLRLYFHKIVYSIFIQKITALVILLKFKKYKKIYP